MLAAVALTVVLDGAVVRSYNAPYLRDGHVMAPVDPYLTAVASSIGFSGGTMVVMRGDRFAQVPMPSPTAPALMQNTYVQIAPVLRALGAYVAYEPETHRLIVQSPVFAFATPTPFNPAVPQASPAPVFTPTPQTTPRPVVTGSPLPRRTPVPASSSPKPR